MPVMHRSRRELEAARSEADRRKREARQKAEAEAGRRADAKLLAEVEAHLLARRKAIEEDSKLSDAERTERRLRQLEQSPADTPVRAPDRPTGWSLCEEDILRRWRREEDEEREGRERKLGITEKREKWDAAVQEIEDRKAASIRKAGERCRESEAAAREQAQAELDRLGPRPVPSDLEKVKL